jgi:hypothetical protein
MSVSVSQAKNAIKRCLWEIVNPPPKNFDEMWKHFGERCAYCETKLERHGRHAHKDHLVAFQDSSRKGIGNFVLSCGACNGDKKREAGWLDYLSTEFGSHEQFESRRGRIESWLAKHADEKDSLDPMVVKSVTASTELVFACLDKVVKRLRDKTPLVGVDEIGDDFEITEEESKRIELMTAQADEEIFAKRKKVHVDFDWDDFHVNAVEKAAALEGLSFEQYLKRKAFYGALEVLKQGQCPIVTQTDSQGT